MSKSAPLALVMPILGALVGVPIAGAGAGAIAGVLKPDDASSQIVSHQIPLTQSAQQKILSYWTPERMLHALGSRLVTRSESLETSPGVSAPALGAPKRQAAPGAANPGALWPATGTVRSTTGKVFFTLDGRDYVCSASTVDSANSDLVVTAGHCAKDGTGSWTQNWIYVPGYDQGTNQYGGFTARRMFVTTAWSQKADENSDVAMVDLNTGNGRHVAQAAGAQGIAFGQPRAAEVYGFGYPAEGSYDGERLAYCSGTTHNDSTKLTQDMGLRCDLTEGSSGGPWLSAFDPKTGVGIVTSVNTFKYADDPKTMYGPYFGATVRALYNEAQHA
jgi:V8-like Glu-specific endopeptidase